MIPRHPSDLPADFFFEHFPECAANSDEDAVCACNAIERDLREEFAAQTRNWI